LRLAREANVLDCLGRGTIATAGLSTSVEIVKRADRAKGFIVEPKR